VPICAVQRTSLRLVVHLRDLPGITYPFDRWHRRPAAAEAVPDASSEQTGQDRGLMVLRVADGSPAALAGIFTGDIVLRIGGVAATHTNRVVRTFGPEASASGLN
jgi:membrane-associated protease RseP (regulator of RpoE activity)